jgi:hypothetical protein
MKNIARIKDAVPVPGVNLMDAFVLPGRKHKLLL